MARRIPKKALTDLWAEEFRGPDSEQSKRQDAFGHKAHCGICGNSGVIDTRGKMFTPAGYECGIRAYCICPNGRALKARRREERP